MPLPPTGKRTSGFDPHSNLPAQIAGSLLPVSEPDATAPTGFNSRMLVVQALANWILTQVTATSGGGGYVLADEADVVDQLGQAPFASGSVYRLTGRADGLDVVLLCDGPQHFAEQEAYTVPAGSDAYADYVPVLYALATQQWQPREADVYPSDDKQTQVRGFFANGTQTAAADAPLAGDPRPDYFYAEFYDFGAGSWYKCLPNPAQPDANGHATAWWVRR